jgi:pimeloyl-ACP methyl ester carboxylesterase
MIRRFLALVLFSLGAISTHAQSSLPSSFQAKTIHSPAGADIFVRWGGSGPVVLLIHGYAENSDSWAQFTSRERLAIVTCDNAAKT